MNYKDEFNIKVEFEIDEDSLGFKRRITFSESFERLPDLVKANLLNDLEQEIDGMFMETLNVLQKKFFRTMGMDKPQKYNSLFDSAFDSDGNFKYKVKEG